MTDASWSPIATLAGQMLARAGDPGYQRWREQVASTGCCSHPIRLRGQSLSIDGATGEIVATYSTDSEPDGTLLTACGNRRASRCPTCSTIYRADTWQLVAAGLRGGKGIPESVGQHPRLFVTLTAPSFGPVHSRRGKGRRVRQCRGGRRGTCPHGRALRCTARHAAGDPALGAPICPDCFDYAAAVLWNSLSSELWRRTTIYLRRALAREVGVTPTALSRVARPSYTKVAEYQARGAIHFHAVIRLDATPPKDQPELITPPPSGFDTDLLADAVRAAVRAVEVAMPDVGDGKRRVARWGDQLDIRVIRPSSEIANPTAVAAYVAKYATKSTEVLGVALDRQLEGDQDVDELAASDHVRRLVETSWRLGRLPALKDMKLRRWAHMLGFRGHFSTKSRRYSVTLGSLRAARAEWMRSRRGFDVGDRIFNVGSWRFVGAGYRTSGDAALASSAQQTRLLAEVEAREQRRRDRREVLAA
jgi:hypothetical protein